MTVPIENLRLLPVGDVRRRRQKLYALNWINQTERTINWEIAAPIVVNSQMEILEGEFTLAVALQYGYKEVKISIEN